MMAHVSALTPLLLHNGNAWSPAAYLSLLVSALAVKFSITFRIIFVI